MFPAPGGRRSSRQRIKIVASGTFDSTLYRTLYLGPEDSIDPVDHYIQCGWTIGCFPHALFDTRWYLDTYEDVRRAGVNPLVHYNEFGYRERRRPNRLFDIDWFSRSDNGTVLNPLVVYRAYAGDALSSSVTRPSDGARQLRATRSRR